MKSIATAIVALSSIAAADATLPEQRAGASWQGRCIERMERARDELTRADRRYEQTIVRLVPFERSVPGDPTAQQTVDAVTLYNLDPAANADVTDDGAHGVHGHGAAKSILERAVDDCLKMMKKRK